MYIFLFFVDQNNERTPWGISPPYSLLRIHYSICDKINQYLYFISFEANGSFFGTFYTSSCHNIPRELFRAPDRFCFFWEAARIFITQKNPLFYIQSRILSIFLSTIVYIYRLFTFHSTQSFSSASFAAALSASLMLLPSPSETHSSPIKQAQV